MVLSSGQAATTTALLALLQRATKWCAAPPSTAERCTCSTDLSPSFGIRSRFVSLEELREPGASCSPRRRSVVWFESPINPTLRCVDIAAVAGACRARGVISVIDNTFASPINQQPIALGVDLVMHSATKYLNGHSDVTAGVLAGPAALIDGVAGSAQAASARCSTRTRPMRSAAG